MLANPDSNTSMPINDCFGLFKACSVKYFPSPKPISKFNLRESSFKNLNLGNFDFRICVEIPIKAKFNNMNYKCLPSYERERIGGKKKVNALKDGLLILSEIVKYFLRFKR